jgi:hypothetical protein
MRFAWQPIAVCGIAIAAACSDPQRATAPIARDPDATIAADRILSTPTRYVAIGTSVSMGWASDGVYAASQLVSWPAQLAVGSLHPISLPLIQSPGCTSPIIAPLILGKRLSGESILGSTVCAPLSAGVSLPTQNVALAGALAIDALTTTPQIAGTAFPWYARVLPPGTTQVTAALAQHPTIVSVELGANEILHTTSGLLIPGVTFATLPQFAVPYHAVLDAIGTAQPEAVLVGLPLDAANFPSLRRADEIWADRAEFAALHVAVSNDCATSGNYINVSVKSLNLVLAAASSPTPVVFSCADVPNTQDLVLTPPDIAFLNGLLAQMDADVRQEAAARGYAYFSLGALFDRSDIKGGKYSIISQLLSPLPYGPFISLDGVHPNALGHSILAGAAAAAINKTYGGFGVHAVTVRPEPSLTDLLNDAPPAGSAIERAKRLVQEHAGEQLSPCLVPGGCDVASALRRR